TRAWNLDLAVQRRHRGGLRVLGEKHGREILLRQSCPLKRALYCSTAADFLDCQPFNFAVVLVGDLDRSVRRRGRLAAKARGPHREGGDLRAFLLDRGLDADDIAVIELESLLNRNV